MKTLTGYCPFCGEFITTNVDNEDNLIIVHHKKYVTLYHKRCYEFNYGLTKENGKWREI